MHSELLYAKAFCWLDDMIGSEQRQEIASYDAQRCCGPVGDCARTAIFGKRRTRSATKPEAVAKSSFASSAEGEASPEADCQVVTTLKRGCRLAVTHWSILSVWT